MGGGQLRTATVHHAPGAETHSLRRFLEAAVVSLGERALQLVEASIEVARHRRRDRHRNCAGGLSLDRRTDELLGQDMWRELLGELLGVDSGWRHHQISGLRVLLERETLIGAEIRQVICDSYGLPNVHSGGEGVQRGVQAQSKAPPAQPRGAIFVLRELVGAKGFEPSTS
jgi:hypothetical protein